MSDLTVFVGTFNRTDTLRNCISNLERQSYPLRIVVVDNGSTWNKAIAYLNYLETRYTVYRLPGNEDVETTEEDEGNHGGRTMSAVANNYSAAFRAEYEAGRQTRWFAVCDCDTAPDGSVDSISRYVELAEAEDIAVGPHLSLNVHRNYPLRSLALIQNARVLFRDRMMWHGKTPYSWDDIDSTFHLFPAAPQFDRLGMRTARVGFPYWATHTDWLTNALSPTPENHAYILGSSAAASWTGTWLREWWAAWMRSPKEAFEFVEGKPRVREDYAPEVFILSWMLQYGYGCEIDLNRSRDVLRSAVPEGSPCWEYGEHWNALVYENDQSCLGWM